MKTWHTVAVLIIAAIMIYYKLHYLALLITALVLFMRGYLYLCERYPRTMIFITAFLNGLLGGRRRW